MIVSNQSYPYIWCDMCEDITEFQYHHMPKDEHNKHGATDLVCVQCCNIVATLHQGKGLPHLQG